MNHAGPIFDLLFFKHDGLSSRQMQVSRAVRLVDDMPEKDFASKSDDEVLAAVKDMAGVELPVLDRANIKYERKTRTVERADMWGDRFVREEVVWYFDVPFSGDGNIFKMKPSTYNLNPPRGDVERNNLRIAVQNEDDKERLKAAVDAILADVEEYLGWHRNMWAGVEEEAVNQARPRLGQRRQKVASLNQAEQGLQGFGFKPK